MKPNIPLLAEGFVLACVIADGAEPVVLNVRAAQRARTKLVDVNNDLSGADGPVTVVVSNDDGCRHPMGAWPRILTIRNG
ncbi:MAG: hypothetical protein HS117_02140 [Verrucomicrobiaceae bacterium]|nr:hypothetical protein [Verrucomicrobiaceae bacterium]